MHRLTLYRCHTDLKPANVLLKADSRDRRGFVAKVGVKCECVSLKGVNQMTGRASWPRRV